MEGQRPSPEEVRCALEAPPGAAFSLAGVSTRDGAFFPTKKHALASLADDTLMIDRLQDRLYAEGRRSLLIVLQGMDCAGKSGTIKTVFGSTSPLGMEVKAFKAPSANELARDYLWRVHAAIPQRGHIGIFDRSHYEDVLVPRVRGLAPSDVLEARYDQINAFEKHLDENGVTILKCMLHVSREEQGKRLRERLERPHKRWKFNPTDIEDRQHWDAFMQAYETAIDRCSTAHAPWYVVPADSKARRNALTARLVRAVLERMDPQHPDPGYRPGDFAID